MKEFILCPIFSRQHGKKQTTKIITKSMDMDGTSWKSSLKTPGQLMTNTF